MVSWLLYHDTCATTPGIPRSEQALTNDIVAQATRFGRYPYRPNRHAPAQRLGGEPQAGGADLAAGGAEGAGPATQERAVVAERRFLCEAAAPG